MSDEGLGMVERAAFSNSEHDEHGHDAKSPAALQGSSIFFNSRLDLGEISQIRSIMSYGLLWICSSDN